DHDTRTDEAVALDLAAGADHDVALDLHERADACLVADATAVEIRERGDDDVTPELGVVDHPVGGVVRGLPFHPRSSSQSVSARGFGSGPGRRGGSTSVRHPT